MKYRQEYSLTWWKLFQHGFKHKDRILPKSKLGKAIDYSINQLEYLKNYIFDGWLEIDNNRAERSFKPFVMGRKGWLFGNTLKGAQSSAIIFGLVETLKENNLKNYIKYLLDTLPQIDIKEAIDQLLPWSDTIPKGCLPHRL